MKKTIYTMILLGLTSLFNLSHATGYDQANWFVSLDMSQIRSKVLPLMEDSDKGNHDFSMKKHVPKEMTQVTLYGNSAIESDFNAVVHGDFSAFDLNYFLNELVAKVDEPGLNFKSSETSYSGQVIDEFTITQDSKSKTFYSSEVRDDLLVISFEKQEVQNWLDQNYDDNELIPSGLVSILINIDNALASMGADLKSNRAPFESEVFQKVQQLSASVMDGGDELLVEAAIEVQDESTANQVKQVLTGLVAMNALSNQDDNAPGIYELMSSLDITAESKEVFLSSKVSFDILAKALQD